MPRHMARAGPHTLVPRLLPLLILLLLPEAVIGFLPLVPGARSNHNHARLARTPPLRAATTPPPEEPPFVSLVLKDVMMLLERTLDTVEDIGVHLRRATERDMDRRFRKDRLSTKSEEKKRVMVLGTGWSAHAVAKIIDTGMYEVVIVSPRNFFLFTPMLSGSAVGTVEFRSISEPIRQANPIADYYEAHCEAIYPQNKTVKVVSEIPNEFGEYETFLAPYDVLVYAVGATTTTFGTPGVKEHCLFLKEVPDAVALRKAIVDRFERASMPSVPLEEKKRILSFVVVGGGPTGVEFSGEFSDFLERDLKKFYPRLVDLVSFKIVQAGATILPVFDKELQDAGLATLREIGIEVLLNRRVTRVEEKQILLEGGETIPYGLCVWAAGTGPRQLTKDLIASIPEQVASKPGSRGRLLVDPYMRVKGTNGTIIAMGDATEVENNPLPATGQVAAQEGAYVARLLNRGYDLDIPVPTFPLDEVNPLEKVANLLRLRGRLEAPPFSFLNLGLLAYVGQQEALAQVQTGSIKLGDYSSRAGNLLWRSVYLVKQVSTRNRILVLFDWMKTRVFGRDISRW